MCSLAMPSDEEERGTDGRGSGGTQARSADPGDPASLLRKLREAEARWCELARERARLEALQIAAISIMEDLDEARRDAEAVSRAKSEFLANMSHEIRSPMNGILGMLELALDTPLSDDQRRCLEAAKGAAEALLGLLSDVLDLSKIEAGRLAIEPEEFSLREVLEGVLGLVAVRAHEKGLEIYLHLDPGVPRFLRGDALRVRQIALNLLGNAVKFTSEGEVSVGVSLLRETAETVEVEIAVRDTGPGIPKDQIEVIFGAFRQAEASIARKYGGTGLGLTISRKLAEAMGGRLWAESEVGRGSAFRCALPFGRVERAEPLLPSVQGVSVLVVEDNDSLRGVLSALLERRGARVEAAADGRAACAALDAAARQGRPIEVVLWDADVPDRAGNSALCAPPDLGSGRRPRLVLMASPARRESPAWRLPGGGFPLYLSKPVLERAILEIVARAVGRPAPVAVELPASSESDRRRLRVLLAEDNAMNRELAATFLRRRGYTVVEAKDGRDAVEKFRRGRFDLVLMDIQMPETDGLAATREIRTLEAGKSRRVPIIALTAYGFAEDRERFLAAGMDGHVAKPVRRRDLFAAIDRVLGEAGAEPFDEAALFERVGGDRELLRRLVAAFLLELPESLAEIEGALRASDGRRLADAAHALKGCVLNFCAYELRRLLERLEEEAGAGDFRSAGLTFEEARREAERLVEGLEALASRGPVTPGEGRPSEAGP